MNIKHFGQTIGYFVQFELYIILFLVLYILTETAGVMLNR